MFGGWRLALEQYVHSSLEAPSTAWRVLHARSLVVENCSLPRAHVREMVLKQNRRKHAFRSRRLGRGKSWQANPFSDEAT